MNIIMGMARLVSVQPVTPPGSQPSWLGFIIVLTYCMYIHVKCM